MIGGVTMCSLIPSMTYSVGDLQLVGMFRVGTTESMHTEQLGYLYGKVNTPIWDSKDKGKGNTKTHKKINFTYLSLIW